MQNIMDAKEIFCNLCKVKLSGEKDRESHMLGKKHQVALHNEHILNKKEQCGVFISGLPNLVPKDKITKYFNEFGSIKDIHIGDGNKYAIISYDDESVAQALLKKRVLFFMGKTLYIKPRKLREQAANRIEMEKPEEDFEAINECLKVPMDFYSQVQVLMSKLQPDQERQTEKYKQLCFDLQQALQYIFPGCQVYPFGSTVTGLNFKNSDVDVYIEYRLHPTFNLNTQESKACQLVKKARNVLPKSRLFTNVIAIPKAKTPIVKCVHAITNVSCDFNFKNMLGVCNSFLIRYYLQLDERLKAITMILKYWAKVHELTGSNGRFTNYALTMLLIFYLQQEPYLLPTVAQMQAVQGYENMQEGWNGGFHPIIKKNIFGDKTVREVLIGFYNYYLNFDYTLNIICPYLGTIVLKTDFLKPATLSDAFLIYKNNLVTVPHLQVDAPICIQDVFEHNNNLTKAVTSKVLEEFIALCKLAVSVLMCPEQQAENNNVLYKLFTDEPVDEKFHCDDNICQFKISMGKVLTYLEYKLSKDITDKSSEIRKMWYQTVNEFIISVLIKVLKFDICVLKEGPDKLEFDYDINDIKIVDTVTFHCKGNYNLWEARKAISRDIDLNNMNTILDKQIYLTNYICDVIYKNFSLDKPIVEFYLTLNARETPIQIEFVIKKISSCKGRFKSLALFFANRLPCWFNVYEKELNDSLKKES